MTELSDIQIRAFVESDIPRALELWSNVEASIQARRRWAMRFISSGSPIADEISYSIEGTNINGIGRKGGIVSLRETLTCRLQTL